ncbi:MAG TPA: hypothetical protein VK137_15745, partial [Planctomycetaceae bacterium]|nr:hypothetical protein [Planctomycetaceae bacterium]
DFGFAANAALASFILVKLNVKHYLFSTRASMTLTRSVSEGERFTGLFDESRQPSVRPRSRFGLLSRHAPTSI